MTDPRPSLTALLELQAVDSQLHTIMTRAQELRGSERISALTARRAQAIAAAKELDEAGRAAAEAVTAAEARVREIQGRVDRDTARLNAGGTAKDLMGLQREIDTLTAHREAAEERQLETMEHAEAVAEDREAKLPLLRAADAQAREAVAERDRELGTLRARHEQLTGRRRTLAEAVPDRALLTRYDTLRTARGGGRIAVARFENATCTGCGSRLSPGDASEITDAPATEVPTCPECSALLVR